MTHAPFTETESLTILGAMRSVAIAGSDMDPIERGLIEGARDHVFELDVNVDSIAAVSPDDLAEAFTDEDKRATAAQFIVLVPYADVTVEEVEVAQVNEYAAALGQSPDSLRDLHKVRDQHINRLLADYGRRAISTYAESSPHGRLRTIARAMHQYVGDREVAARYDALSDLPEGSLGHTFHKFYRDRGFALPGEHKSLGGDILTTHDCCHILGGFNTDGTGEINVAGFEAGSSRNGFGYELLLEVLLDFHLGINFGGGTVGLEVKTGEMNPDTMMVGIKRGLDCNLDIILDLDFWSVADQQITDLRERYNIIGAPDGYLEPPAFQQVDEG